MDAECEYFDWNQIFLSTNEVLMLKFVIKLQEIALKLRYQTRFIIKLISISKAIYNLSNSLINNKRKVESKLTAVLSQLEIKKTAC